VRASQYVDALRDIPELAHVGPLFKSAEPLLLTEEETEYNIAVVVHVFEAHVLLQFNCTNTVQEQVLENVSVAVDLSEAVRCFLSPERPSKSEHNMICTGHDQTG
jgi:coatomer protein complex subunit gamma